MIKLCLALTFILFTNNCLKAQSVPDRTRLQIDSIFKKWDDPKRPGAVIGVVRNDSLIYTRGYGLADVEHNIPNTPQSLYYMCSVSKQFAGYLIAQLVKQGTIDLNADIHTYLPWMGDLGAKVTVSDLVHHTSGIRDDITLADITNKWQKGMLTDDGAIEILKKQRSLNFVPGEKFAYSNSNYVLLAQIVKTVTGEPFRTVARKQIFGPLGMVSSGFVDDPYELIPGRALSYNYDDKHNPKYALQDVYTMGDGGMFTNIDDMAKWAINLYAPVDKDATDLMLQQGLLNNGERVKYAFGISIEEALGYKEYYHNGSLAGYRTAIGVFPEQKMAFIIFGNTGESEVSGKITQLAALFIKPKKSNAAILPTPARRDSALAIVPNVNEAKQITGTYFADDGYRVNISLIRNKLWVNEQLMLKKDSAGSYSLLNNAFVRYRFTSAKGSTKLAMYSPALTKPIQLDRTDEFGSKKELANYIGTYTSRELDHTFQLLIKNDALFFINADKKEYKARVYGHDHLVTDDGNFNHFKPIRDKAGRVIAVELNKGGLMHIRFDKVGK